MVNPSYEAVSDSNLYLFYMRYHGWEDSGSMEPEPIAAMKSATCNLA